MDWQPIDTAPRDGTDVLLNAPNWLQPVVAYFHRKELTIAATRRYVGYWEGWSAGGDPGGDPTLWKPIDV